MAVAFTVIDINFLAVEKEINRIYAAISAGDLEHVCV